MHWQCNNLRSCKLVGRGDICWIHLSTISYTFLIGLRSELCGGQERCWKSDWCSAKKFFFWLDIYRCIIVHEVSIAIMIKMQYCRVYLICQHILVFFCPRRTSEHHFHAKRTYSISWYSPKTLPQCEADKMDSWPLGVLAKFDVFHQYKIGCSVIHPTILPVFNPQISSAFFPGTTVNELLSDGQKWVCSHRHSIAHSYPLQFFAHRSSWNLLGRNLVDELCQLNYRRVPVLPYNSSETTPITL